MTRDEQNIAIAAMLPAKLLIEDGVCYWRAGTEEHPRGLGLLTGPRPVRNTEWLYIIHLVEQELDNIGDLDDPPEIRESELSQYIWLLGGECKKEVEHYTATFDQRAKAMCRLKRIK